MQRKFIVITENDRNFFAYLESKKSEDAFLATHQQILSIRVEDLLTLP